MFIYSRFARCDRGHDTSCLPSSVRKMMLSKKLGTECHTHCLKPVLPSFQSFGTANLVSPQSAGVVPAEELRYCKQYFGKGQCRHSWSVNAKLKNTASVFLLSSRAVACQRVRRHGFLNGNVRSLAPASGTAPILRWNRHLRSASKRNLLSTMNTSIKNAESFATWGGSMTKKSEFFTAASGKWEIIFLMKWSGLDGMWYILQCWRQFVVKRHTSWSCPRSPLPCSSNKAEGYLVSTVVAKFVCCYPFSILHQFLLFDTPRQETI